MRGKQKYKRFGSRSHVEGHAPVDKNRLGLSPFAFPSFPFITQDR